MERIVFHLDMDAFFAAVEERDHPEFAGCPIVVGADPKEGRGRGVVSTANYEARKYGVGSAMPISKAWSLCKEGERRGGKPCIFFGGGYGKYAAESERVMDIVTQYAEVIEQVSVDECYFEIGQEEGGNRQQWERAEGVAKEIKAEIKKRTKLTASIGIGPNKLVAKIASDLHKPDGLTVVPPERVEEVFAPLPLRKIPGIGPKAATVLAGRGANTVADACRFTREELSAWFGKWGSGIYASIRGEDSRPLETEWERKSLGHETTFMEDERDPTVLVETIRTLAEQVAGEVQESGLLARRITLRIRFGDFTTLTRQTTLERATDTEAVFEKEALKLFMPFLDSRENPERKAFRLLGIRAGELTAAQQLPL
jgi:DNA polymerase IV (DinB-like DNA polymerase)